MRRSHRRRVFGIAIVAALLAAVLLLERGIDTAHRAARFPDVPAAPADAAGLLKSLEEAATRSAVAVVAAIVDGDSVTLASGERVRYLAIDTPERGEPLHDVARDRNRALVEGRPVRLVIPAAAPRDAWGRTLAAVFLIEGGGALRLVNRELVANGLARVYLKGNDPVTRRLAPALVAAQVGAVDAGRGLWGLAAFRERAPAQVRVTRDRYHRPDCPHIRGRSGPFDTVEAAVRAGKSPCRTCRP